MLRVFNNTVSGQIFQTIANCFLDYMPAGKFRETNNVKDADIILAMGTVRDNQVDINILHEKVTLSNLKSLSELYGAMHEKRWIIWFDTTGPNTIRNPNIFNRELTGLRDSDIIISSVSVSRPNTFTHLYPVEKAVFKNIGRFERNPKSVVISHDNLLNLSSPDEDTIGIIAGLLDAVSHLYVTKHHELGEDVKRAFGKNLDKVSCENLSYPKEVSYKMSQSEFALSTPTKLGIEFMGIEAGMTGCQPIYPDTEFYRDAFDNTGVVFYDTDNPVESLKTIIESGSKFDNETTEAFRTKFSAEDNLPVFWNSVFDLFNE